ncbi:hypothetical protein OA007_02210 [SAR116 cluster bacterium]|nr:hypothetical protein [SAR116 cluster bacterium]
MDRADWSRRLSAGGGFLENPEACVMSMRVDGVRAAGAPPAAMLPIPEGTADTLSGLTNAPQNYESASQRFINPEEGDFTVGGFAPGYLPRAAVEQAGQLAGSLATRAGGGVVGGLATGGNPVGIAAGALAGPALFEFVQQLGPIAIERARNNGREEPAWEDWTAAAGAAGVSGALNAIGVSGGRGASFLNKTLREGVTEGTQSVTQQTGETAGTDVGLQIDPRQAVGEGIIGGTTAGGFDVAGKTVQGATRIFTGGGDVTDPEAATDLANRLQRIVEANNLNMSDVDKMSTKGAREAVDKAHIQIAEDMKRLVVDLRDRLKITDIDPITTVVDKVFAEAGRREARNKTKSVVGRQEFDATERLVGDTLEGQELLRLYRQSNELTELHNSGYVGGISRFTDQISPFASNVGYTARSAAELPTRLLATGAGFTLNPAVPAAQGAAVLAGRGVDAITGRRSRVGRFIKQNRGEGGVQIDQDAPSLRQQRIEEDEQRKQQLEAQKAAEAQQQADEKAMHKAIYDANGRFFEQSPQQLMLDGLGLSPQRAVQLLEDIAKNDPTFARTAQRAAKAFREGGRIPSMRYIGPKMKAELDSDQPRVARDRPVIAQRLDEGIQRSAAIQQGINDNRDFNDQLKDALNADRNIDNQSKAVANAALDDLRRDLGKTPVSMAEQIERDAQEKASDPNVIRNYVTPYVDRVRKQQGADDVVTDLPPVEPFIELRLPEEEPPKRKHREIGELLMAEQAQRYGRDLDPYNDGGDFETVAQAMTDEARFQFEKTPNAADWYDEDIKEALQTTTEVIPEIAQSEDNRQLFLMLTAITSVGHKPRPNWRYAGALAMHYFHTGDIGERGSVFSEKRGVSENRTVNPTTGKLFGPKAPSIEPGINIIDHMVKKMGVPATLDWINSDKTKKEIDAMRKEAGYGPQSKIKGGMNAVVPGIQMFGPKVGPFYLNLNGIKEVTVDLWASRTVRRHTGGLLAPNYDPNAKKQEGTGLIDAPTELERPTMKNLFTRVGENLGVTPQAAQAILWAYEQELYNDLGAKVETQRFSEGAEEFIERDAVAYAERYPRSAERQNRGGTRDGPPPAIEESRQYTFDFGDTRPERPQPDTGRQDTAPLVGSKPATSEQIREVKPATDAMFEVGKPGGEFENGIPDLRTAEKLAKALGASLYVVNNKNDLARVFGRTRMGAQNEFVKGGAQMRPDPTQSTRDRNLGQDVRAVIGVLSEYNNPRNPEETVTAKEAIWHALHEIGHVIEGGFVPGETKTKRGSRYKRLSDQKDQRSDRLYDNTFRQAVASLLDGAAGLNVQGYSQQDATDILNEIVQLQRKGVLDDGTTPVRDTYPYFNEAIDRYETQGELQRARSAELQLMRAEDSYFQTPQELAADLIGFYLMSPKQAKQQMPKATKLVRDILNSSKVVTFYSMPLATLVAAIFANMLVGEQEEEDQRGALSLGQGALSA